MAAAKEKLGGWYVLTTPIDTLLLIPPSPHPPHRLNQDMVLEQLHNVPFSSLKKMDFPNCSLKHVDLSPVDSFSNLLRYSSCEGVARSLYVYTILNSLNLESNSLTSFSGLIYLNQLKVGGAMGGACNCLFHTPPLQPSLLPSLYRSCV